MDQVFIQHGRKVSSSMNMSKNEFEKILMHGAAKILAAKTEMVSFQGVDIEALIEEGLEKYRTL